MTGTADDLDSVELAVISNRFEAIVRAMMNTLLRTARSGVLNTGRDFSCCMITGADELLAMAESHADPRAQRARSDGEGDEGAPPASSRRGDAFLHNSPYHGNSHAADHTILVPVIDDDGSHRFTVLAQGPSCRLRQRRPHHLLGRGARRLRGRRADLPVRAGAARLRATSRT